MEADSDDNDVKIEKLKIEIVSLRKKLAVAIEHKWRYFGVIGHGGCDLIYCECCDEAWYWESSYLEDYPKKCDNVNNAILPFVSFVKMMTLREKKSAQIAPHVMNAFHVIH